MKKIFTMLSGILFACSFAAHAEDVTVFISDYDGNTVADPYTTTLTQDADGNYVMGDFVNSGTPLVFGFEQPEVNDYTDMTFPQLDLDEEGSAYVTNADGKYATCYLFGYNGQDVTKVKWPYVFADGYSYVERFDGADGYEYCATICVCGFDENSDYFDDYFYLTFWFNGTKGDESGDQSGDESGDESKVTEDITVYILDYDDNEIADPYTTTLTQDADGNYVMGDFVNSGTPLVFSFEQPEVNDYTDMTFPQLDVDDEGSAFVTNADGKYATCYFFGYNGEDVTKIKWPYVYADGYSYVERFDGADGYEYCATIECGGADSDGNWLGDGFFLSFWFNGQKSSDDNGVDFAEAVKDAPIEYFNLQGVKVAEPANGIFIRKQGAKTVKVAIK
ncbi:MAG: hypothetical protein K2L17_13710 [Muribaculaceae bacterium]|nr:hypothetical protein [Muribaculaceae bacterium]